MRLRKASFLTRNHGAYRGRRLGRRVSLSLVALLTLVTLVTAFAQQSYFIDAQPMTPASAQYAQAISGVAYGASDALMQTSTIAAQWPQQQSTWCGIATVAAIAQFDGAASTTQQSVADYLNSSASVSVWRTPTTAPSYYGPGFAADISRDFGTDPRSLAAGLSYMVHQPYHQVVALGNAYEASASLAAAIATMGPVTVFVDHALHSVVVSAVYATGNPVTDPSSITGFDVWDPAGGSAEGIQSTVQASVPLYTWLTGTQYWGAPYRVNWDNGYGYDPNPAVGPYTYDPSTVAHNASLWVGHYVYIKPDASGSATANVSADWAVNQDGSLIKGFDGQIPTGYTGPTSLFEGAKVVLPETSPYGLAFSARGSYDSAAAGSAPAAAIAWTGTDALHHLNVLTTNDGLNYGGKLTLPETSYANLAMLVAPPATAGAPNVVVIAWLGTNNAHSLNVLYDVYGVTGQQRKLTMWNDSSANTPALAWYNGQIWLAWTGTNSGRTLNVIPLGPQGVTPGAKTTLWSAPGAGAGPHLSADTANKRLLLSWTQVSSYQVVVMASSDNVTWSAPARGALGGASYSSPDTLALPAPPSGVAPMYLSMTSTWRQLYIWRGSSSQGWTAVDVTPESSFGDAQMGYLGQGGAFMLAWSGTDAYHHLNLAMIQM